MKNENEGRSRKGDSGNKKRNDHSIRDVFFGTALILILCFLAVDTYYSVNVYRRLSAGASEELVRFHGMTSAAIAEESAPAAAAVTEEDTDGTETAPVETAPERTGAPDGESVTGDETETAEAAETTETGETTEAVTAAAEETEAPAAAAEAPVRSTPQTASPETEPAYPVNINTAGPEALMTLPMIGESRAAKIIEYRELYGGFSAIEEIMNVNGIGTGIFEKIRDLITV